MHWRGWCDFGDNWGIVCWSLRGSLRYSCRLELSLDWLTTAIQSTREVHRSVFIVGIKTGIRGLITIETHWYNGHLPHIHEHRSFDSENLQEMTTPCSVHSVSGEFTPHQLTLSRRIVPEEHHLCSALQAQTSPWIQAYRDAPFPARQTPPAREHQIAVRVSVAPGRWEQTLRALVIQHYSSEFVQALWRDSSL